MSASISSESFTDFFHALWGYDPFPWQKEFAARLCAGFPPSYVTAPTGSGKTACLDAAIFALAVQAPRPIAERTVGRRIFFIVNRRIIVDEAFSRAGKLAFAFKDPEKYLIERENEKPQEKRLPADVIEKSSETLSSVAQVLRGLSGGIDPLACTELRGGIYRDRAWAKSLIQPMILCSTVDQAGSRLLFRGYGISAEARPVHAALVAHDSLLLLDEAHISQPFLQTLDWVAKYRRFEPTGGETVKLPFMVVKMTATPPAKVVESEKLGLSELDKSHPVLGRRLNATKNTRLVIAKKAKLTNELEAQASQILENHAPHSLAIMVNRVATARDLFGAFKNKNPSAKVTLVLGRMRPLDRDEVTKELQKDFKTGFSENDAKKQTHIVISTQCLEVGADLDFDALVTECASIDALRQRFGRLNRDGRSITSQAVIVLPEEQNIGEEKLNKDVLADPIYGNAIPRTWRWMKSLAIDGNVDFGLNAMTEAVRMARDANEAATEEFDLMLSPRLNAPVLLPAYLDCWVQTNPAPAADPDVSLFLHGPQRDMAEVQVCWRADLPLEAAGIDARDALVSAWKNTLALCPPTTLECLPVPLHVMRDWLGSSENIADLTGDAPAATPLENEDSTKVRQISVMIWRGAGTSELLNKPSEIRPGDTLVLRAQDGGWNALGHVPNAPTDPPTNPENSASVDCAEKGHAAMRRRAVVRVHPAVWQCGEKNTPRALLLDWSRDPDCEWNQDELKAQLMAVAREIDETDDSMRQRLQHLGEGKERIEVEAYPDGCGVVLSNHTPFLADTPSETTVFRSADDGPDDPLLDRSEPQTLSNHTADVTLLVRQFALELGLAPFSQALESAANLHDWGKADPRFQALLVGGIVAAAPSGDALLAKSVRIPVSALARKRARERAGLPNGFRHEMLSLHLASLADAKSFLPDADARKDLTLHLIASHHGHARPFAPVVDDSEPPDMSIFVNGKTLSVTTTERLTNVACSLDSDVSERFWQLTRRHGWWGLALLEANIRLADQQASANPSIQ
jgi:CRISPR-associated endonuclease/helicase Cas3